MPTYSGRGAGSFGSLGGEITFEWVPSPEMYAQKLMHLAGYLENFIPPLEASKGIAKADMQNHFDTETSPGGAAWAELAKSTIRRRGSAHPILQMTGEMHDAAVSDAAYDIFANALYFNAGVLPPYSMFHESGRASGDSGFTDWAARAEAMGLEVEGGGGGSMPARPFIGLSFDAEQTIIEAFDAWFAGGISGFYTRSSGVVQTRTLGGQFGPKVTG